MYLAYLDPASGSQLAMAIVAGFAGTMVAIKLWWRRVLGKFRRQPPTDVSAPARTDQDG